MRTFSAIALLALNLLSPVACDDNNNNQNVPAVYANAHEAFQDLLNALPEESLHAALNGIAKFKEGVFESTRHGVEHVHAENPPLATKLIVAAVHDLKKRQNPPTNGTVSSQPPSSPSSTEEPASQTQTQSERPNEPSSSREPAIVISVPVTQTNEQGQTTVVQTAILSEPTESAVVTTTRTNSQGSVEVATETRPAIVVTTTDSAGSSITTTSPVPTYGEVLTTTNAEGSTFLTTYTPGGGRVSSIKLITTTGADGKPSVVTSYTYVDATATGNGDSQSTPTTGTARPGLQSGAAVAYKNRAYEAIVMGGAAIAVFV